MGLSFSLFKHLCALAFPLNASLDFRVLFRFLWIGLAVFAVKSTHTFFQWPPDSCLQLLAGIPGGSLSLLIPDPGKVNGPRNGQMDLLKCDGDLCYLSGMVMGLSSLLDSTSQCVFYLSLWRTLVPENGRLFLTIALPPSPAVAVYFCPGNP